MKQYRIIFLFGLYCSVVTHATMQGVPVKDLQQQKLTLWQKTKKSVSDNKVVFGLSIALVSTAFVAAEREWENEQLKRQLARDPDRLPENQQEWVHEREDLRSAVEGSDRAIAHLDRLWRKEREEVALQESNYNRINTKCGNLQQAQQRIQQENDTLQAALHRVEGERNQLTGEFVLTQNEQERLQKALNVQRKKVVLREKQILFGLYQYRHLQKKNAEQEQTIQQQRATIADLEQQAPEMVQEEALPAQNLSENEDCVVKPSPSSGWGFDGSHLTLGTLRYLVAPFYSPIATLVEDVQIP